VWSRLRLSGELSAQGITTINTVAPRFFPDTGFFGGGVPEERRRVVVEQRRAWPGWAGRRTDLGFDHQKVGRASRGMVRLHRTAVVVDRGGGMCRNSVRLEGCGTLILTRLSTHEEADKSTLCVVCSSMSQKGTFLRQERKDIRSHRTKLYTCI
jgi:hypothetical protein